MNLTADRQLMKRALELAEEENAKLRVEVKRLQAVYELELDRANKAEKEAFEANKYLTELKARVSMTRRLFKELSE